VRFGLFAAVVGTAGGVVLLALDGFAAKHLADSWSSAPAEARATALAAFRAEDSINFALLSPLNLVFAGFTFVLYGLARMGGRDRRSGRSCVGRDSGLDRRADVGDDGPGDRGPVAHHAVAAGHGNSHDPKIQHMAVTGHWFRSRRRAKLGGGTCVAGTSHLLALVTAHERGEPCAGCAPPVRRRHRRHHPHSSPASLAER
jgi:hypothetical protein